MAAQTFADLTPPNERARVDKNKTRGGDVVISRRRTSKEVKVRKQRAGAGMAATEPDTDREQVVADIRRLVAVYMAEHDDRAGQLSRDEALVRVLATREGRALGARLRGMSGPPELAKRLARALGLPPGFQKAAAGATFGGLIQATRSEAVRKALMADPFGDASATLAARLERGLVDVRPDIARLGFEDAVEAIERAYPGWLDKQINAAGRSNTGGAAAEVEKRARQRVAKDPDLSMERARDAVMAGDPALAARVLDEEA